MTRAAEHLLEEAMRLDAADRAELVDRIAELIDPAEPTDDPTDAAEWGPELRDRLARVERGEVVPIPWREAMAKIQRGEVDGE